MRSVYQSFQRCYDSKKVELSLREYLVKPSSQTFELFYYYLAHYSQVRSTTFLRPYKAWIDPFAVEDLGDYFTIKLMKYFGSGRSFKRDRWIQNPAAYLGTFFTSRAIEFLRKAYRESKNTVSIEDLSALESSFGNPEAEYLHQETTTEVSQAIQRLSEIEKTVVLGKWQDGKTSGQIAQELDIRLPQVYEATRKARRLLRADLKRVVLT